MPARRKSTRRERALEAEVAQLKQELEGAREAKTRAFEDRDQAQAGYNKLANESSALVERGQVQTRLIKKLTEEVQGERERVVKLIIARRMYQLQLQEAQVRVQFWMRKLEEKLKSLFRVPPAGEMKKHLDAMEKEILDTIINASVKDITMIEDKRCIVGLNIACGVLTFDLDYGKLQGIEKKIVAHLFGLDGARKAMTLAECAQYVSIPQEELYKRVTLLFFGKLKPLWMP